MRQTRDTARRKTRRMARHISAVLLGLAAAAVLAITLLPESPGAATARFWTSLFLEAREAEHYDSLAAMRDASDAVVVGRITSVTKGRIFGDPPDDVVQYVTAVVEVESVLKGQLKEVAPNRIQLEIMVPGAATLDDLVASTPVSRSVYFLRHKASELEALGAPADVVAADQLFYRLVILRGVIWESADAAHGMDAGEPDFLTQLNGRAMNEVIRASTP